MWDVETYCKELEDIVNIDSNSDDTEGIGRVGKYLLSKYEQEGMIVESSEDFNRIAARTHSEPYYDILLIGHMDTVFPKGTVKQRPFHVENLTAYGPGVADMKGGDIMMLHLVRYLKKHYDFKIGVLYNGDEEIGSPDSRKWIHSHAEKAGACFVFEPGRVENAFVRSRKGCFDLRCEFKGKAAHAGTNPQDGRNALVEMAEWVKTISEYQDFKPGTTVTAGLAAAGSALNVVPEYASLGFDVRYSDPEEYGNIVRILDTLVERSNKKGIQATYKIENYSEPMNPSAATQKIMDIFDTVSKEQGVQISWKDVGGVSDANNICDIGMPIIDGCGPVGEGMHSGDERLYLNSVLTRLTLLAEAIPRFAGKIR